MTEHHHDGDWIGELIDPLVDAALDVRCAEDIYPENSIDNKPLYKAADAALDAALDVVDGACANCVRELVALLCRHGCPSENARADSDPLAACRLLNWVS